MDYNFSTFSRGSVLLLVGSSNLDREKPNSLLDATWAKKSLIIGFLLLSKKLSVASC